MARSVSYDTVAEGYDRRYVETAYPGIEAALAAFAEAGQRVLEVGCGTGHWLGWLAERGCEVVGVEPSMEMLGRARKRLGERGVVLRGRGEALPLPDASVDRVAVINALHHFEGPDAFVREARRVLRPGGRVVVMGMDPSRGQDRWFVYDHFPRTLELDVARYPSTEAIAGWYRAAGLEATGSEVAEHLRIEKPAREYLASGTRMRDFTSQLMLLDEVELEAGIEAIRQAEREATARGETLMLAADLKIFATYGEVGDQGRRAP